MRAALLAGLVALALPTTAVAQLDQTRHEILGDDGAVELAQQLAEATEEQGICYGWRVLVGNEGDLSTERGSNFGPDRGIETGPCRRKAEIVGEVSWTCGSCEPEDSSSFHVEANFRGAPTKDQIRDLGLEGGNLHKGDGDEVLAAMAGSLPVIAASNGVAEAVPAQLNTRPIPAADKPENSPSTPDWLRESWLGLTVFLVLAAAGIAWFVIDLLRRSPAEAPAAPEPESTPTTEP